MFMLGLMLGVIGVVMALRAIESGRTWQDHYPDALMHLFSAHSALLQRQAGERRCTPDDLLPHMQALRILGNDLEPAFPGLDSDRRFTAHAREFRSQLDQMLADPPHTCALLEQAITTIRAACRSCHQDFRN